MTDQITTGAAHAGEFVPRSKDEWMIERDALRRALEGIAFELDLELKTRGPEPISEKPVKRAITIARHALKAAPQV